jgi:hypothetical protein
MFMEILVFDIGLLFKGCFPLAKIPVQQSS